MGDDAGHGMVTASGGDIDAQRVQDELGAHVVVSGFTPMARPTSAIGRPSLSTIPTACRRNSGGNFEGRPLVVAFFFPMDMDFLLYESVQRGEAQSTACAVADGCQDRVASSRHTAFLWRALALTESRPQ